MSTAAARSPRVAIVGGGHNALAAAAYLGRAGVDVTVLERLEHVGGAAVSAQAFAGVDARLSRYSYLVSLLPQQIIDDLGLAVPLARRRYSSYTPVPGSDAGLLVDEQDADATRASFAAIGAADDADRFADLYRRTALVAQAVFPTMTERLPLRADVQARAGAASAWAELVDAPIAHAIEAAVSHDVVRGVVATDALIGTFDDLRTGYAGNRCMLYHVVGGGTGDWDVPIGGMGRVSGGLADAARAAGARIRTGATVTAITPDGDVTWVERDEEHREGYDLVLSGVAPAVLARLLGEDATQPEGAQVKVNMVLSRLPRLRGGIAPEAAFGGTFHVHESWSQLDAAQRVAAAGGIPDPLPCEIYCHTLSDPSILSPELAASGAHTLTVFGLQTPDRILGDARPGTPAHDALRDRLQDAVLRSLDAVLAEPIAPLLLPDADGRPCIETKTTRDIEDALAMPGGDIFHGALSWPWLDETPGSVAEAWGVETAHDRILMAGSGARRGGAVSGVGGHNAAHAALELLGI
ncbi:phytoene desaturase family protein [Agrococcus jejuensis]|uniref:Pyridine nucleotide-disulfide oxidoreductase domain-containing protein 2 n=1 Tax=Agrococcus jejuensis TaxID=399736 RepID=A0A1G8E4W7_9MICO|nr:NAD(P)/FAD-dependent oxidoreductase [Agrococcus jejuensis]SDH64904.1 Phytoene dehydrogenase-related protein [Agrococcus jejuensis]